MLRPTYRSAKALVCSALLAVASSIPLLTLADFAPDLLLRDVAADHENSGDHDPGHTEFELLQDYWFVDENNLKWTAPAGYVVNGASIPRKLWEELGGPWSGKYRNAAVLHDYFTGEKLRNSKRVNEMFLEAMLQSDVSPFKARLIFLGVHIFGDKWDEITGFVETDRREDLTESRLRSLKRIAQDPSLSTSDLSSVTLADLD